MSNKNKNTNETQVATETVVEEEAKKVEVQQFSRCSECHHCNNSAHVGTPSIADRIKLKWHQEHFDNSEFQILADGRHRHYWKPKKQVYPSLKQFARSQEATGDEVARDWLDHKMGSLNEERSEKNKKRVLEEKMASKAARRKSKAGGKSTTAEVAAK